MLLRQQSLRNAPTQFKFTKQNTYHTTTKKQTRQNSEKEPVIELYQTVQILRNDLHNFPTTGLTNYQIYSPKIIFKDPYHFPPTLPNNVIVRINRRWMYRIIATVLKYYLNIYFDGIFYSVVKFQELRYEDKLSTDGSNDGTASTENDSVQNLENESVKDHEQYLDIQVRWVFEATPRYVILLGGDYMPSRTFIEGVFLYRIDRITGLVTHHVVKHIDPAPRSFLWVNSWLSFILGSGLVGRRPGVVGGGSAASTGTSCVCVRVSEKSGARKKDI